MSAAVANPTGAATGAAPQVDQATANADYMARSRRFPVRATPVGGGLSSAYGLGDTLEFIFGPVNNGWLEALVIDVNISLAIGTAAGTPNAAFPWNVIQAITVNLDGQISYCEPYFAAYILPRLKGVMRQDEASGVLAGIQNSDLQSILYNVPNGTLPVGNNTIHFRMYIPLNALHPLDGSGLLPLQGTQDPVQINIICPSSLTGADPFNAAMTAGAGQTTAVNAGSVVSVFGLVRDGRTMWSPDEQLPFYPDGLPQVSYDKEPNVINLVANDIVRGQMTKVLKVYYAVACIIDGNQSNKFAVNTNLNSWDLSADSTGSFKLQQYGLENIPMDFLWEDIRRKFKQDFPEGIIPFVYAPHNNIPNPDAHNSTDVLNQQAGGWTSLYQGVNLATLGGVGGIQPRIKTWVIGTNDSPYIG